jgi:hypothetical protein
MQLSELVLHGSALPPYAPGVALREDDRSIQQNMAQNVHLAVRVVFDSPERCELDGQEDRRSVHGAHSSIAAPAVEKAYVVRYGEVRMRPMGRAAVCKRNCSSTTSAMRHEPLLCHRCTYSAATMQPQLRSSRLHKSTR